jgi:hypothetical protein
VLVAAVAVLVPKLLIASRTFGTQDVGTWLGFARGVRLRGPVGVYSIDFARTDHSLYNHPPLMGWYLALGNVLSDHGVGLGFTIRAMASAADVASALLVFEILRRRAGLRRACASGLLVGTSPALLLISGYHGNTDPVFVMLVLLGAYLIVDREAAAAGGAALALAVSIKLVPVVALATVVAYLWHRRDLLLRASLGFGATFVLLWTLPVATEWSPLRRNVLGYAGVATRQWGIVQVASGAHGLTPLLIGPGRALAVLAAALVPALVVWHRQEVAVQGVCFALVAFLALSPAFGVQYLAWAVAAGYVLHFWLATAFNLLAGLFLFLVYDTWNHGLGWSHEAFGRPFTTGQLAIGLGLWALLVLICLSPLVTGDRRTRPHQPRAPQG